MMPARDMCHHFEFQKKITPLYITKGNNLDLVREREKNSTDMTLQWYLLWFPHYAWNHLKTKLF